MSTSLGTSETVEGWISHMSEQSILRSKPGATIFTYKVVLDIHFGILRTI